MKVVILSDIHGNLEALSALREKFDELWVLGDLVNYGPDPAEVIEFVRANASVIVRGNHDHAIGFGEDPRCSPPFREMAEAMTQYTKSVLSDSQKQFLRDIPLAARRDVDGLQVSLCHAAPSDPLFAYVLPILSDGKRRSISLAPTYCWWATRTCSLSERLEHRKS
jgi:protein phosphatase